MSRIKRILDEAIANYLEAKQEEANWKAIKEKAGIKIKKILDAVNRYTYNSKAGSVAYPKATKTIKYKKDMIDALVESGQISEEVIEQARSENDSRRLNVNPPRKRRKV